jgi:hypothetical protein
VDSKGTLFAFLALITGTHTLAYFSKAPVTKKVLCNDTTSIGDEKKFYNIDTWGLHYKTFYGSNFATS